MRRRHQRITESWRQSALQAGMRPLYTLTNKSRYQRRQMRMRALFWRRLFAPVRAFMEGFMSHWQEERNASRLEHMP